MTDFLEVLRELNLKQFGGSNCEISRVKKREEKSNSQALKPKPLLSIIKNFCQNDNL